MESNRGRERVSQGEQDEVPTLDAPVDLVEEYVRATLEKRKLEERLAYLRAELELHAAAALSKEKPKGAFACKLGRVGARLVPTCAFDRDAVAAALQKAGKLDRVAVLQGPRLRTFLEMDKDARALVEEHVRFRTSVTLVASEAKDA